MKALSIRQPWADLILYGLKNIETRGRNTSFRGRFLLHTSQQLDKEAMGFYQLAEPIAPLGSLIGIAELKEVVKYETPLDFKHDLFRHGCWWDLEPPELPMYGYILKDIKPLPIPVAHKGQLGFFEVPNLEVGL